MSCSRGNVKRTRAQKHQNRTAFKNDLHDSSNKLKFLNSLEVTGVCSRCKEIIEWKIKFKKYKPLPAPRKCVACEQKTVKYAYHVFCNNCASERKVCAKCCKAIENTLTEVQENNHEEKIKSILKTLPERRRRTILRYLNKQEQKLTAETLLQIEDLLLNMDNVSIDDDCSLSSGVRSSLDDNSDE